MINQQSRFFSFITLGMFYLIHSFGCATKLSTPILHEGIYLPHNSGQQSRMILIDDTLYSYHINGMGIERLSHKVFIESHTRTDSIQILKGKIIKQDVSGFPDRSRNFYVFYAMRTINENEISAIDGGEFNTPEERDSSINALDFKRGFGQTLYRKSYFDSFSRMKPIKDQEDLEKILTYLKSDEAKSIIDAFERQNMMVAYNWTINTELLNKACLKNGLNPLTADRIDSLYKARDRESLEEEN